MSIFEFRANDKDDGYCIARVEADNKREAQAYVRGQLFVRELSYRETIEAAQRGLAIVDAKTGKVIGGEVEADQCPPLVVSNHGG